MGTNDDAPSLDLRSPWMNAAGSLGFVPDRRGEASVAEFGAFVTNPISLRPRKAAQGPRLLSFPGGVLIHTGHPNIGLRSAIKNCGDAWARAELPIILHLLAADAKQLRAAIPRIEELENILAIELSIEADSSRSEMAEQIKATAGELPVIAQLPFELALELGDAAIRAGASAISLGPPRGSLPGPDGKLVAGRLFGPALFPQTLSLVSQLVKLAIPVIAAGGIVSKADGEVLLAAGALAVQLDITLWK